MQAWPIPSGELAARNLISDSDNERRIRIELTEVLRPASSNHGIIPVEEESFHRAIIETAQKDYYTVPNTNPIHVSAYFTNAKGKRRSKHELARALSKFRSSERPSRESGCVFQVQRNSGWFRFGCYCRRAKSWRLVEWRSRRCYAGRYSHPGRKLE